MLIDLSGTLGHLELAAVFQKALGNEEERLESVRGWLSEEVLKQAQA